MMRIGRSVSRRSIAGMITRSAVMMTIIGSGTQRISGRRMIRVVQLVRLDFMMDDGTRMALGHGTKEVMFVG